jgi:hypothetical protein
LRNVCKIAARKTKSICKSTIQAETHPVQRKKKKEKEKKKKDTHTHTIELMHILYSSVFSR